MFIGWSIAVVVLDEYKCPGEYVNIGDYGEHMCASLLKRYFRELPDPLLTFEAYDMFVAAEGEESSANCSRCVRV